MVVPTAFEEDFGLEFRVHKCFIGKSANLTFERAIMPRSKLENYEIIMQSLVGRYLSVDTLAFNCGMDCIAVSKRIDFLMKNGLIEEKKCHSKTLYALTKRGQSIQKALAITKLLDTLKVTVKVADEELTAVPRSSEDVRETGQK